MFWNNDKNNNNFEYISLQEATKFCNYSQEYLSLRARTGKLKSMKLGRNWVTTKEWLVEYAGKVDEYNDSINNNNNVHKKEKAEKIARAEISRSVKEKIVKDQIVHSPPENLPIIRFPKLKINFGTLRPGFAAALVFILIMAGGVFGKESLFKTYNDVARSAEKIVRNIATVSDDIFTAAANYKGALVAAPDIISDYGRWLKEGYIAADEKIERKIGQTLLSLAPENAGQWVGYADKTIERKIGEALLSLGQRFSTIGNSTRTVLGKIRERSSGLGDLANDFVKQKSAEAEQGLKGFKLGFKSETMRLARLVGEPFIKAYQSIAKGVRLAILPWRGATPAGFEELKTKMAEFEKEPVIIKRIEVSKVVEPVKEITRETETIKQITRIDDAALAEVRANMVYLEGEIGKRLYAPGGVVSQTIYVTEPVSSPKIYQENGEIVLQTLGSGNVILTAATGLQLYGQQVVLESTNLLNPLIYLASKTRIGGDTTITGTMAAGSTSIGGTLSVSGATAISGNLAVTGDITVTGAQSITAASDSPALTVTQTGSGETLRLAYDNSNYLSVTASSTGAVVFDAVGSAAGFVFRDAIYQPTYGSDDGLVLYLPFSEGMTSSSASIAYDRSPFGNDGTATNMPMPGRNATSGESGWATTTCKVGSCMNFDGVNDYVNAGNNTSLDLTTNLTIEAWIYWSDATKRSIILSKPIVGAQIPYHFRINETNSKLYFSTYISGSEHGLTSTATISVNQWTHVVVTFSKPNLHFYINGVDDGLQNFDYTLPTNTGSVAIGNYSNDYFIGSIDEVRMYNRSLSADEVRTHYLRGANANGALLADKFRIIGTDNNIDFQSVNGTTTIANGLIVDTNSLYVMADTNYVGFGTTTPRYKLDVWGDLAIGTSTGTNVPALYIDSGDGGRVGIGTTTLTGLLTVGTSTPVLVIDVLNNVGIATSSPSAKLAVAGTIFGTGQVIFTYAPQAGGAGNIADNSLYINPTGAISDANLLTIADNGTWKFRVDKEGDVFLQGNLITAGSVTQGTTTIADLIVEGRSFLGDAANNDYVVIQGTTTISADNANPALTVTQIGSGYGAIITGGNVGIGTTTPRYLLDVWGDMAIGTSTNTNTPLLYVDSGAGYGGVGIGTTTLSGNLFTVGTTTPSLVVASNGYVGIGTTTPSSLFTIGTSTNIFNVLTNGNVNIATVNGLDIVPGSDVDADLISVTVTGSPRFYWDESEDRFSSTHGLTLAGTLTSTAFTPGSTAMLSLNNAGAVYTFTDNAESIANVISAYYAATSTAYTGISIGTVSRAILDPTNTQNWTAPELRGGLVGLEGSARIGSGSSGTVSNVTTILAKGEGEINNGALVTNWRQLLIEAPTGAGVTAGNVANIYGLYMQAMTGGTASNYAIYSAGGTSYFAGDIGIATTSPRYKLDVWGDMAVGTSTDTNTPLLYVDSGNGYGSVGIGTTTLSGTLLTVGTTTPSLVVAGNGYVGIGTNAPASALEVFSSVSPVIHGVRSTSETNTIRNGAAIQHRTSGDMADGFGALLEFQIQDSAGVENSIASIGAVRDGADNSGALTFYTRTLGGAITERMRISTAGLVGIGTTTPRYKLDVWGDLAIGTSTDTNTPLLYVDSGTGYGGVGIGTTTLSGNLFTVGTTTPSLVVANNGYVGIGTTTPSALFTVGTSTDIVTITSAGSGSLTVNSGRLIVNGAAATDQNSITSNPTRTLTNDNEILNISSNPTFQRIDAPHAGHVVSVIGRSLLGAANTQDWTADPTGHTPGMIGVEGSIRVNAGSAGTMTRAAAFFQKGEGEIRDGAYITNLIGYFGQAYTGAGITAGKVANLYGIYLDEVTGGTASNYAIYSAGGTSYFAGDVGIATTSPRYKLDVWGDMAIGTSTGTNVPALYVDSGEGGRIGIGTTTLAGLFTVGTSTQYFLIDPTGKTGIGATTTPNEQLSVAGNIMGSGNIILYGTAASSTLQGLIATGLNLSGNGITNAVWNGTNIGLAYGGTGATLTDPNADRIMFWDDSLGQTTWLTVGANLNLTDTTLSGQTSNWQYIGANAIRPTSTVGIIVSASSTIASTLDVTATTTSATLNVGSGKLYVSENGYVGIGTTTPRYKLDIWGDMAVGTSTDTNTPLLYVDSGTGYGGVGIGTTTLSGNLFTVGTTTPSLVVASNGYVGIGTTTPSALFTVGTSTDIVTITSAGSGSLTVNSGRLIVNGAAATDQNSITSNPLRTLVNNNEVINVSSNPEFAKSSEFTSVAVSVIGRSILDSTNIGNFTRTTRAGGLSGGEFVIRIEDGSAGTVSKATGLLIKGNSEIGNGANLTQWNGIWIDPPTGTGVTAGKLENVYGLYIDDFGINSGTALNYAIYSAGGTSYFAGNVGIATTTPRYKLDVWGDMAIGTSTGTNVPALYIDSGEGGRIGIGTTTLAGLFTVGTSTPALVVAPNSWVGIASSTPSDTFAVQGNILGVGNLVLSGTINTGQGATEVYLMNQAVQTTNAVTFADLILTYGINAATSTITATSTLASINADSGLFYADAYIDRVGIATTTPRYKLDVWGDMVVGTTTNYGGANMPLLYVDSGNGAGKIGIATSTPRYTLDVWGSLAIGTTTSPIFLADTGTTGNTPGITIGADMSLGSIQVASSSGAITFADMIVEASAAAGTEESYSFQIDSSELFRIYAESDGSGGIQNRRVFTPITTNFGIGTTTPRYTLDVYGTMAVGTSSASYTGASSTPALYVLSGNGGQVGIGTTTLAGLLTVGTSTPYFIIDPAGKTGVGATTTPTEQLSVAGNIMGSGNIILYGTAASSTLQGLIATGLNLSGNGITNAVWNGTNIGLAYGGTGATLTDPNADRIMFWDDSLGQTTWLTVGANLNLTDTTLSGQTSNWQYIGANAIRPTSTVGIIVSASSTFAGTATTTFEHGMIVDTNTLYVMADTGYVGIGTTRPADKVEVSDGTTRFKIGFDASAYIGTRSNHNLIFQTNNSDKMVIDTTGNVGIATTTPRYKLDVWGDIGFGTSTVTGTGQVPALYIDSGEGGRIGIGTTTLAGLFTVGTSTPALVVNSNGNVFLVQNSGNVGIGTTTPYAKLTINESDDFAFGGFNEKVLDNMEGSALYWTQVTGVTTSTESAIVKTGGQSLKFTVGATEDVVLRKQFSANQDLSGYERIGFWIYADRFATSSATTTQLLSFSYHDAGGTESTSTISFQQANRWQYQEIALTSTAADKDAINYLAFRTDFGGVGNINFYVDQIRAYNSTERSAEMFVGKDGALVLMGRGGVEIGRADGSSNKPGIRVDSAVVEFNQPMSVNVGGDVGMNNDLQFLSAGLSQITSEGPLRIAAGDSNHSENLTLTTGGSGDVIVELTASSSAFMITHAWAASTTVPFIINSESNSTTTAEMDRFGILFQVISDYGSDENTVFSIDASGNFYYDRGAHTPAADVAENYYVTDESIEAGDVVCLNGVPLTIEKCSGAYESDLLGVISTQPALLMGNDLVRARAVALAGRVPVKISNENGPIAIGDSLTSASSSPGLAMKAIGAGKILGYALEPFGTTSTSEVNGETSEVNAVGTIYAFINLQDRSAGDLTVFENAEGNIEVQTMTQTGLTTLFTIDETGALVVDKIKTNQLCVGSVCVTENEFMQVFGAGVAEILGVTGTTTPDVDGGTSGVPGVCTNGANQPCSSDVGVCQIGVQICEQGQWGECIGAVFPTEEILDEVDNDCDGTTDEGLIAGDSISEILNQEIETPDIVTTTEPIVEPDTSISTSTATTTP